MDPNLSDIGDVFCCHAQPFSQGMHLMLGCGLLCQVLLVRFSFHGSASLPQWLFIRLPMPKYYPHQTDIQLT